MTQHTQPVGNDTPGTPPVEARSDLTPAPGPGDEHVMELLHDHVPLSLLMDLAQPGEPDSRAILEQEGEPEGNWWEPEKL